MRVLLIEDDDAIADLLRRSLAAQHYLVEVAADGQQGWEFAAVFEYDLILLDLMLPRLDGISFCKRLRQPGHHHFQSLNHNTPILLMTAEDTSSNRVMGLDAGADDYITKPFDLDELLARVRALLRRGNSERSPLLKWGQLQLDPSTCQVSYKEQPVHLSSKEYRLLELFLRHPQRIFSHGTLIEHLWALEDIPTENAVRAHIKGVRKKLKEVGVEDFIETVYGLGYRLKEVSTRNNTTKEQVENFTPDSQSQQQISTFWEQYRGQYCDRLSIIEQAVSALQTNTLTEELGQQAQREAHTLKGSLGLFGLARASELSREIEQLLKAVDSLDRKQKADLSQLTFTLRQELEQPLPETKPSAEVIDRSTPSQKSQVWQRSRSLSTEESRLLIVDDDAQLLEFLQVMLQPWGFQVSLLSDSQQFWHILEEVKPDLLMLDIEMPEVNGIELCQEVRNHLNWGDLPILMISASNDDETIQRVFMAGADDYVSKPIRAAELVARTIRRLEHAKLLKKLRGLEG